MQLESMKKSLPYLHSAAYIIGKTTQILQVSFQSSSRDVRCAEKFYSDGNIRVLIFGDQQGR